MESYHLIQTCIQSLLECQTMLQTRPLNCFSYIVEKLGAVRDTVIDLNDENLSSVSIFIQDAIHCLEPVIDSDNSDRRLLRRLGKPCLNYLLGMNFTVIEIAGMFGVSKVTMHKRLKEFGLSASKTFAEITDDDLDTLLSDILLEHPNTGYKRMIGYLRTRGIKVQINRVRMALLRVDPIGVQQRRSVNRAIYRRTYFVEYAMELWHIDTHHKLIRWGFVVRGGVDGKSRAIVYLDAGCDNTSVSHFENFMEGVQSYGVPLRTRSDKGGENVDIARFMLHYRGTGRGSHICGRSVHNQRIERLWRDVYYGCLSSYKAFFCHLEELAYINIDDAKSIAILQYVFLPRIRSHLKQFMEAWNHHPISSERNKTPLQLMLINLPPQNVDIVYTPAPLQDSSADFTSENIDFNEAIQMENFRLHLFSNEIEYLNQFNIMRPSNNLGADIFIEIMHGIRGIRSFS